MNEILDKVLESSKFYSGMLQIDFKQIGYCYQSLKPYFYGDIACELGPSIGVMTKMLLNNFKELDVIEGSKELLDQIPNHPKLTKYHSLLENFTPSRKYSTIIMSHVLEHIAEPLDVLKRVALWLEPGGVVIISVPNAKSFHRLAAVKMGLLSNEYQLNDRDQKVGHYRIYDLDTLSDVASNAGLTVKDKGGILLKFLSFMQMEQIFDNKMLDGFYELGKDFPANAADIYVVCKNEILKK